MSDIAKAIENELTGYTEEIEEIVDAEIDKISMDVVDDLKNNSNIPVNTGKYKKSFYAKLKSKGRGYNIVIVCNKKYRLTHLLEKGHITRNGGRTKAYPHWKQAETVANRLYQRLRERIKR